MTGTAPSFWGDDTLYSEATCLPEDLYYEGSEDEDYESPEVRRLRYEAAARRFLDGETPLIMSATLQGPFEESSGWTNPWRSKYRTKDRPAMSKKPLRATKPSGRSLTHTIPETQQPESQQAETQDSLECHLPSPESIKNASQDSHPFLEKDAVALVQTWRNGICPAVPDEDKFWAPDKCAPDTSLSTPKPVSVKRKRAKGSDWLKRKPIKKPRTDNAESFATETPSNRAHESSRRHTKSSVTTSTSNHRTNHSETGGLQDEDQLAHKSQHLRRSSRKSIPTAKCQSHRKDTQRVGCRKDTESVDELAGDNRANIKAAATLSSPVSLKNGGVTDSTNQKACGNNSSQSAAKNSHEFHGDIEHPPQFNEADNAVIPMEDLEMQDVCKTQLDESEAQRDESFIYRLRSRNNASNQQDTRSSDISPSSSRRLSTHSNSSSALSSIEDDSNVLCPEVKSTQFEDLRDDTYESGIGFNDTTAEDAFSPSNDHVEDDSLNSGKQMIASDALVEMIHLDQTSGHGTDTSLSDPARSMQAADGATLPTSPSDKEPCQSESLPLGFGPTQSCLSNQTDPTQPQETQSSALPTSSGFSLGGMLRRLVPSSPWSRLSQSVSFDAAQGGTDRVLEPTERVEKKAAWEVDEDQDATAASGDKSSAIDSCEIAATAASNFCGINADGDMADASSESTYQSAEGEQDQERSGPDAAINSFQSPWSKSQATQALSAAILKSIISYEETVIPKDSSITQHGMITDDQDQLDAEILDSSPSMHKQTEAAPKSVDIGSTASGTMGTSSTVQPTLGAISVELPRPSTPEPRLPFKPFSAFMTPSPEYRARRKQLSLGASVSRPGSSQRMLASAMKKPWSASKSSRRVSWAPLPGSDTTEGSAHAAVNEAEPAPGETTFARPVSPPPIASVEELPPSDSNEFRGHFSAVVRRAAAEHLRSNGVVDLQESAQSPVAHAMADMFISTDEIGRFNGPSRAKIGITVSDDMESGEPDFRDMTDEVFRDIEELLQPYNLEMEMEQAGRETVVEADLTAYA